MIRNKRGKNFASLLAGLSIGMNVSAANKPNLVVVLVDDHAFEAVSAYGTHLKDHVGRSFSNRLNNSRQAGKYESYTGYSLFSRAAARLREPPRQKS